MTMTVNNKKGMFMMRKFSTWATLVILIVTSLWTAHRNLAGLEYPTFESNATDNVNNLLYAQSQAELELLRSRLRDFQQNQSSQQQQESRGLLPPSSSNTPGSNNCAFADSDICLVGELWKSLASSQFPRRRVLTDWKPRAFALAEDSVVLLTHGSFDKLDILRVQLEHWNGPASVALYWSNSSTSPTNIHSQLERLDLFLQSLGDSSYLPLVTIHLVLEQEEEEGYPHNILRTVAMEYAGADYIVALDADFIPGPPGCHAKLQDALDKLRTPLKQQRRLLVLPAFEVLAHPPGPAASPDQLPTSKADLMVMVQNHVAEPFHVQRFYRGHGPTNYTKWMIPDNNTTALYYPISYEPNFEPYVLAYRPGLPRYWTSFRGYGMNKLSWFRELHRAGYSFGTLTEFYVVHLQHPSTTNNPQRKANAQRGNEHLDYLQEQYPIVDGRRVEREGAPERYHSFDEFRKTNGK